MLKIISKNMFGLCMLIAFPGMSMGGDWYNGFDITQLMFSHGANNVRVTIQVQGGEGNSNPDSCDYSNKFVVPYSATNEAQETAMLSGVLTAYASGDKGTAYLSGCISGIGGKTYPKLHYFYMSK